MILTRIFLTLILLFQLSTGFSSVMPVVQEPKGENPKSLLMIGNSFMYYNTGVHNPLVRLIRANAELGKGHKIRAVTINGSSLSWHDVNSYINNPNIGSFSISSKNVLSNYDFTALIWLLCKIAVSAPFTQKEKICFMITLRSTVIF